MEEEFEDEPRIGGYAVVFVDELPPRQTCPVCLHAMRNPVQTVCGHRFCESCLLETFRGDDDPPICPEDRNPFPEDGGVFRDVACEREILSLRVKCNKSDRGCEWIGQLRYYEEHFVSCKYEDVKCNDCEEEMQRGLLQKHSTSECPNRMVQCEHCEKMFALCDTKFHADIECTRFPVNCPQECGEEEMPREEVESHVRDDCVMTLVHCPYEGAGCTFYDNRRHLKAHLVSSMEEHLSKTWSTLSKTTQRLDRLEGVLLDKEYMEHRNNEEISDLRQAEKKLELENERLREDIKRLRKEMVVLREVNMKNKDESNALRRLVQTKESKVEVNEEKPHEVPLPPKPGKNYAGEKMDDSRIFSAAVGLRTGAGKICSGKHAETEYVDSDDSDDEYEIEED